MKERAVKRIPVLILSVVMVLAMMTALPGVTQEAYAGDPVTDPATLTYANKAETGINLLGVTGDKSGPGWNWDSTGKVLTLDNIEIQGREYMPPNGNGVTRRIECIQLPNNQGEVKVVIKGNCYFHNCSQAIMPGVNGDSGTDLRLMKDSSGGTLYINDAGSPWFRCQKVTVDGLKMVSETKDGANGIQVDIVNGADVSLTALILQKIILNM
ncbi:MAG: hypothetical protein ACOX41_01800 [Anaerovoracaceae bacterium]